MLLHQVQGSDLAGPGVDVAVIADGELDSAVDPVSDVIHVVPYLTRVGQVGVEAAGNHEAVTLAPMSRVLITGMSGAGKTTLLHELTRRGYRTIDTDVGGWVLPDGTWDEVRMSALLASNPSLVVSGTVENQGRFYDRFAAVVLLSAPVDVLLERVSVRTNNPYGNAAAERSVIRRHVIDVEPLLRDGATLELDGRRPVSELADEVEPLVASGQA